MQRGKAGSRSKNNFKRARKNRKGPGGRENTDDSTNEKLWGKKVN